MGPQGSRALDAEGHQIHDSFTIKIFPALQAELEYADANNILVEVTPHFWVIFAETLLGFELPLTRAPCARDVRGSLGHQHRCVWKQLGDVQREPHGKLLWLVSGPSSASRRPAMPWMRHALSKATNLEDAYTRVPCSSEDPADYHSI